jgi:hypothetical protein
MEAVLIRESGIYVANYGTHANQFLPVRALSGLVFTGSLLVVIPNGTNGLCIIWDAIKWNGRAVHSTIYVCRAFQIQLRSTGPGLELSNRYGAICTD